MIYNTVSLNIFVCMKYDNSNFLCDLKIAIQDKVTVPNSYIVSVC